MAEGARLESVYVERHRGFDSLPHRHYKKARLSAGLFRFGIELNISQIATGVIPSFGRYPKQPSLVPGSGRALLGPA